MTEEARILNKQNKSSVVAAPNAAEAAVVPQDEPPRGSSSAFDLAGLGDKDFAISVANVEQSRHNYNGNWIADKHANFCQLYGSITVPYMADDEEEQEPELSCQSLYGAGLCAKQLLRVQPLYDKLKAQCASLLRQLRSVRRSQGYVPIHGVLIVVAEDRETLLEMYMLSRVSFSPFDFSAVRLHLRHHNLPAHADTDISSTDRVASFQCMAKLLYDLAVRRPGLLATANYKAVSLGTIVVDGPISMLEDLLVRCVAQRVIDSETDKEESIIEQRKSLLKRAFARDEKTKPQPKRRRRKPQSLCFCSSSCVICGLR